MCPNQNKLCLLWILHSKFLSLGHQSEGNNTKGEMEKNDDDDEIAHSFAFLILVKCRPIRVQLQAYWLGSFVLILVCMNVWNSGSWKDHRLLAYLIVCLSLGVFLLSGMIYAYSYCTPKSTFCDAGVCFDFPTVGWTCCIICISHNWHCQPNTSQRKHSVASYEIWHLLFLIVESGLRGWISGT